ncbi:Uncharacterised protein [Mycobacteroides abscessus]|nr:Uncharacterised protein [Mycobacteroides abscessus]CPX16209.1 Uncharacterised protein [Mycobacteroides abscessus]SHS86813.1 Uncharacterised protein [Mycobacteroides abscessus subsp. abscessus]SHU54921.1 Uncharacterised protein [Mycobacteroides abscessus subsp. abscessus]
MHRRQHRIRLAFKYFLDAQTSRQQILERTIVQPLGHLAIAALVGTHRFQDQLLTYVHQLDDARGTAFEHKAHTCREDGQPQ